MSVVRLLIESVFDRYKCHVLLRTQEICVGIKDKEAEEEYLILELGHRDRGKRPGVWLLGYGITISHNHLVSLWLSLYLYLSLSSLFSFLL